MAEKKVEIIMDDRISPVEIRNLFSSVNWNDEANLSNKNLNKAFNLAYCNFSARNINGELVGIIRATYDGMYVFLWNLVVHPHYQGHGIGKRLFSDLLNKMQKRGHKWIVGLALKERIEYYERIGLPRVSHLSVISTYSKL